MSNEALELVVPPRGDPISSKKQEQRGLGHSSFEVTGIFLYQGQTVDIEVKGTAEHLEARIGQWGGYNDVPDILNGTQTKPFTDGVFKLQKGLNTISRASSGGMVYLVNYSTQNEEQVIVRGGVKVPYYKKGETSVEDFKNQLDRYAGVPFIEMESENAIATIRLERVKNIFLKNNQVEVFMDSLDKVAVLEAEAAGLSYKGFGSARKERQRIHLVNPSFGAGALFATDYFLGIHSAAGKDNQIFSSGIANPDWGLLHEVGHTYQNSLYNWTNMGEVTVNIYADYAQKKWTENGTGRYDSENIANGSRVSVQRYFEKLAKDPFWNFDREALETSTYHFALLGMFITLPRTFGYDFYPILNQQYRSLEESKKPRNAEEQKQLFIIMASKVAKRNLLPFFEHWRFPISDETKEQIRQLDLLPLEKEIWKDILATKQEETSGKYRISDSVGQYTVPNADVKSTLLTLPFEEIDSVGKFGTAFENIRSEPIASNTFFINGETVSDKTIFTQQIAHAFFMNDEGVTNKLSFPIQITPGNAYVMSGQRGVYATLSYNKKSKKLVAGGNGRKIMESYPNNIYPEVKIYDATMKILKKTVTGYGKMTGVEFSNQLNDEKLAVGDVVQIYHKEAQKRVVRYMNGASISTGQEIYYYKITNDGWEGYTTAPPVTNDGLDADVNLTLSAQKLLTPVKPVFPTNPSGETGNVGNLTLDNVTSLDFGTVNYSGESHFIFENANIQVTDNRGTGKGWQLAVSMTDFRNVKANSEVLKGVQINIPKGDYTTIEGNISSAPQTKNVVITPVESGGASVIVMSAYNSQGMGTWVNILDVNKIKIIIPEGNSVGRYDSTLTWMLEDIPEK